MTTVLLVLAFLGFLSIVAEDFTKIDKAKTTLFFWHAGLGAVFHCPTR